MVPKSTKTESGKWLEQLWGARCTHGCPWSACPRALGTKVSHFRRLLGSHFGHFLTFFCYCFLKASLRYSFGACATTRVTKVGEKGAKMEPKSGPVRLRDMCLKHGIYCTGSTSGPPGSVLKADVSSNWCRESSWMALEAHWSDLWTVLRASLGDVLRTWGHPFSVTFSDAFPGRPLTSCEGRWQARGCPAGEWGFPIRDIPGPDWYGVGNHTPSVRPSAWRGGYLKAHSAEPATVPWCHSGTASERPLICRYLCR